MPGLDGLRAVAVVAVMVYHANHEWLQGGFLGVEVFFVISGYLITLLLIGEKERNGKVDLKQFWLRRFRRLLPALFVMLAAVAVYMAVTSNQARGRTRGDFLSGLLYGSNWYQVFVGQGYAASEAFVPLRHLWSLAVEEQFYLVWPLIMVVILKRSRDQLPRMALWLAGVSGFIAVAVGIIFYNGNVDSIDNCVAQPQGYWRAFGRCISVNDTLYLSTISRAGGLMLGAAFAMVWRPSAIMRGPMRRRPHRLDVVALVALVGLGAMIRLFWLSENGQQFGTQFNPWLFRGGFFLVGLATLAIIAATTHRRSWVGRFLGNPVLRWVGTRSYGMYLYHWPIYQIIRKQAGIALTLRQFVGAMILTAIVTELSFRIIEMPIRRGVLGQILRGERRPRTARMAKRRQRSAIAGAVAAGLVAFAGVSIAVADNSCVGSVDCQTATIGTPAPTVPSTTTTTIPASTTTAVTLPGETAAPTTTEAPTTTVDPLTLIPPVAIGESVMQGAIPNLSAGGFLVNAAKNRGGDGVIGVLQLMKQANQLGSIVVIQVGTNGSVSDAQYDTMMSVIGGQSHVYFLTVKAPNRQYIIDNNVRITALPTRYPNVTIIDWNTQGEQVADKLCQNDHVHISCKPEAAQFFANMIFSAVGLPTR